MVRVYDKAGRQFNWDWVVAEFGDVKLFDGDGPWRIVELREAEGPAVIIVTILDRVGNPVEGAQVARWWPAELPLLPSELAEWNDQGVYGSTNVNGQIGFGMGNGDYYWPPAGGASQVWTVAGSDMISGLGMEAATNHRHLNVVFQWVGDEPPPEPPPPEPPPPEPPPEPPPPEPPTDFKTAVLARLDSIIAILQSV